MSLGQTFGDFISSGKGSRHALSGKLSFSKESSDHSFRLVVLKVFSAALIFVLLAQLFRSQILMGAYYRELSDNNRAQRLVLHASRGIIYDRNGTPLVQNLPAFRLVDCEEEKCQAKIISKDQAIDLEANDAKHAEKLEVDSSRFYVYGENTAHLLGYVSEISPEELKTKKKYFPGDRLGRAGVEQQFEDILKGKDGVQFFEVDATGEKKRVLSTSPAVPGKNVTLAMDWNLQRVAAAELKDKKGAVVVSNPQNGEILTMVSASTYNPNVFTDLLLSSKERSEQINSIFNDPSMPLFNRVISGTYPPGSTFKIVTSTAGLETGKIKESTTVEDTGVLIIGPYKFPNWKFLKDGGTQGVLNVAGALQKSNDIFFYRAGEWIGVEDLGNWATKMGVSRKLGINLPGEQQGIFPNAQWQTKVGKTWYLGDTYHLAIGQGDLLTTPLQVNYWTNVIAGKGKVCQPTVLKIGELGTVPKCETIKVKPETVKVVMQGLLAACSEGGTAYPLFNFKVKSLKAGEADRRISVACKTGTAEFGDPKNRTHAWLTAFAPAENPEISVTVLVEAGGEGSDTAAPIVKKILEEYFTK